MERLQINVQGLTCQHCIGRVERAVSALESATSVEVSLTEVRLEHDPGRLSRAEVEAAIREAGYSPVEALTP